MWGLFLGLATGTASAQYFGQNKVQYRELEWATLKTHHFEIYFHNGEKEAAYDAGRMAERAYDRLSIILDHQFSRRIPVILYASQTEFQQTNVSSALIGEGTGGFTEFAKRRVAVPLTGSYREFDHVLTHELVHAFQLDIVAGGSEHSVNSAFQSFPPLWFAEGMAEYLSIGAIDPQTEMWLRDGALRGYLTPISILEQVEDIRVYRYGQAALAYLGATYGDQTLGQILRSLPRSRGLDKAFESVVGLTLKKFSEDWTESVRKEYLPAIRDHQKPEEFAFRLTEADRDLSNMNVSPAVSPDGSQMVYFSDRSMYNDLYLASALSGRVERRLVKGERKADFESLRFYSSSMDFSPDGKRIAFVALDHGLDAIDLQQVKDGKIVGRICPGLDGVQSPCWSPDGQWIAFSGLQGGRTHLFRVRTDGSSLEQLTDGRYLAAEPHYSADGGTLVFVTDEGAGADPEDLLFGLPQLALFDLATRAVKVMPRQAGRNLSPHFFPDGSHLLFISDRSGIANLYIRDLTTGEDRRITDILTGVSGVTPSSPAVSLAKTGKRLVFSAFTRGSWDLYSIKDPLALWDKGVPWSGPFPEDIVHREARPRPIVLDSLAQAAAVPEPIAGSETAGASETVGVPEPVDGFEPVSVAANTGSEAPAGRPSAGAADGSDAAKMDSLMKAVMAIASPSGSTARPLLRSGSAWVPPDSARRRVDVAEVLARQRGLPDIDTFEVERYHPRFTADYVTANGFVANNVGLAAQSVIQFSDLLGEKMFLIGANIYGSISDSDLLFEFVNLRHRTSWGVSAYQYRSDFYSIAPGPIDDQFVSQIYRGANLTLQRPFNRFSRIEWSVDALDISEEQYQTSVYGDQVGVSLTTKRNYIYVAPGLAMVTDNTVYGSTGPIGGGRQRVSMQVGTGDLSFRTTMGDFRRYVNVRQRYALAGRVLGAFSAGRDPQYFRIGGPYTLRGYEIDQFRGTNVAITNLEFRFPLIENLALGFPLPLSIQGVRGAFFFDAGGVWDHNSEFRAVSSSLGRRRLDDIKASYGLSAGVNMGFTVIKWDLAWRTDLSRNIGPARGYLSFGLDY
jgi:Tol biopolymer transport system component